MRLGVLAIQGSFSLHVKALTSIGVEVVEIRKTSQLQDINGIIIPGGESTTFQIIMSKSDLGETLKREIRGGLPVWGTCAGSIMLGRGSDARVQDWEAA